MAYLDLSLLISSITNFRTEMSGILPHHMTDAIPFKEARSKLEQVQSHRSLLYTKQLLRGSMLVGHGLNHDFSALHTNAKQWSVAVRDTALSLSLRKRAGLDLGKKPSLRDLSCLLLGRTIQSGSHCSKEHAKVCPLSGHDSLLWRL